MAELKVYMSTYEWNNFSSVVERRQTYVPENVNRAVRQSVPEGSRKKGRKDLLDVYHVWNIELDASMYATFSLFQHLFIIKCVDETGAL